MSRSCELCTKGRSCAAAPDRPGRGKRRLPHVILHSRYCSKATAGREGHAVSYSVSAITAAQERLVSDCSSYIAEPWRMDRNIKDDHSKDM